MDRRTQAEATISDHVIYAIGGASIPLPLVDIAAVSAIQLNLVRDLAEIYEVDHDVTDSRTLITSLVGASLPRVGASALKALPGVGWLAGALTQVALSGATTYAVGQLFSRVFASGRSIASVDTDEVRSLYDDFVREGRVVLERVDAQPVEANHSEHDGLEHDRFEHDGFERAHLERERAERRQARPRLRRIARVLVRLERLRDSGAISESEFERLKGAALSAV